MYVGQNFFLLIGILNMRILWCPTISEDEVECTLVGSGVSGIWLTVIHVLTFKVFLEAAI